MTQLYKSHRVLGFKISEAPGEDGTTYALLQTSPREYSAAPLHMLLPVTDKERHFEAMKALLAAVERCAFLGVDLDTLPDLLRQEIALFKEEQR